MKSIFILIAFLISIQLGYAQTDSVTVEYSTDSVASKGYKTGRKYKYLDRNFIEEKHMTRVGIPFDNDILTEFFIEHERKIGYSSAISIGYNYKSQLDYNVSYKYFYSSKKKIKAGLKANNLNGTYITAKYSNSFENRKFDHDIGLKWGFQQRIGRFGFFGIETVFDFTPSKRPTRYDVATSTFSKTDWINFKTQFKIGFAIGSLSRNNSTSISPLDQIKSKMSKITNQLKEDKTFLKIGLYDFHADADYSYFNGTIALEQKLWPSLSIISEIDYTLNGVNAYAFKINPRSTYNINSGFRYYYSLQKRIQRGISANNFSANYISQMALDLSKKQNYIEYNPSLQYSMTSQSPGIGVFWGMQRKIGRIGFVDFNIGYNYRKFDSKYKFDPEFKLSYGIGR